MHRLIAILTIVCSLLLAAAESVSAQARRSVTVGIVADGPWRRHADLLDLVRDEIRGLLSGEFDLRIPAEKYAEADWTLPGIQAALERLLADPEVDIVVTMGAISSHVASRRGELPKPLIAPLIIDAQVQGLPSEGGGSGVRNLSYIALPQARDVEVFGEIVPFTRIAILGNGPLAAAIPELPQTLREAGQRLGVEPVLIPVGLMIDPVLQAIDAADVDAVFVLPQMQIGPDDWRRLVQGFIDRRLPSFSWMGRREVDDGIFAGLRPERFYQRIARRVAINIQRILLGEEASTLQTAFAAQGRVTINMATARAIGVYPPFTVMTEAELVADVGRPPVRQLSLERVVEEALDANLELAAGGRNVAAGEKNIGIAKSILWPQIDVSADWSTIDSERASAPITQPQRVFSGSATATWLVLDETLWANTSVQKSVQRSRVEDYRTLRLDVVFDAAVTYLNVLTAKAFERIERDNLRVTRENLELAEIRNAVGTASPGEVFRWRSKIANDRQSVIDANVSRNLAEIELNRILNRPLEEPFGTSEADISDPVIVQSQERLYDYMDNQADFRLFRRFMVREALEASPEIQSLQALADAQRRTLQSTTRAFYLPNAALQATVTDIFNTGGAGSELFPDFGMTWSLGLRLAYPVFTGAARVAERGKASEQLAELETQRDAVAQRVEQRVRSALHEMSGSLANIELSTEAADAALNSFSLVQDSYSRGVASIVELLDAQNAALVSELLAATAVYDYLIDFIKVERASGRFDFFASEAEREAFFERLEEFFQGQGVGN